MQVLKYVQNPMRKSTNVFSIFFLNLINLDTSKSIQGEVEKRVSRETMFTDIIKGKQYIYRKN